MAQNIHHHGQLALFAEHETPANAAGGANLPITILAFIRDMFVGFFHSVSIARTLQALHSLDDRQLADIGIERAEIPDFAIAVANDKVEEYRAARKAQTTAANDDAASDLTLAA